MAQMKRRDPAGVAKDLPQAKLTRFFSAPQARPASPATKQSQPPAKVSSPSEQTDGSSPAEMTPAGRTQATPAPPAAAVPAALFCERDTPTETPAPEERR